MRQIITVLTLVLVLACSAATRAADPTQAKPEKTASKSAVASHSTSGVVKSIDGNTLVLTRPGKKNGEMTFTMNGSTQKDGTIGVGSNVTVRYQSEGKSMVATGISEQPAKQTASSKAPVKK